uniref:Uncharacterized protein n=1 Tax=Arundo donax TaxID=35708 RepID=A0A0A9D961_ARUDO
MGKKRAAVGAVMAPVFPFLAAAAEPDHFSDYGFDPQLLRFFYQPEAQRPSTRRHQYQQPPESTRFKLDKPISSSNAAGGGAPPPPPRSSSSSPAAASPSPYGPRRRLRERHRGMHMLGAGHAVRPPCRGRARRRVVGDAVRQPQGRQPRRRRQRGRRSSSSDAHLPRDVNEQPSPAPAVPPGGGSAVSR